jgi:hypothetical protein
MAKISVFLTFSGGVEFDPMDCDRQVGFQSTSVWRQKRRELLGRADLCAAEWQFGFDRRDFDDVDDAVTALLNEIWMHRAAIKEYASRSDIRATIAITVMIVDDAPLYRLSRATLSMLGELQVELVVDIFDYSGNGSICE